MGEAKSAQAASAGGGWGFGFGGGGNKNEVEELKEKNEEPPEDWYVNKWVRFYFDQKQRPQS